MVYALCHTELVDYEVDEHPMVYALYSESRSNDRERANARRDYSGR